ncbi:MAG: ABC transporter substrate-binding protein [Negativicoccus massiliensis]|nr:ABC transporter substrate-binding protein [Negativicoccus massiliensis]
MMEKNRLKKAAWVGLAGIVLCGALAGCGATVEHQQSGTPYSVGLVQIVQHPALDEAARGIADGMTQAGLKEGTDYTLESQNAQGDQSNLDTIVRHFLFSKKQLIYAVATPAAQAVANATHEIPVVATAVTDFAAAGLVKDESRPQTNVTGTSDRTDLKAQLDLMRKLTPQVKTLGVIYNAGEVNSELQVKALEPAAQALGMTVKKFTVASVNDIPQTAHQMTGQVDAVYVPTDNVVASALPALIAVTNEKNIPVYGAEIAHVKNGALASVSVDYYKLGLRAGMMGAQILKGEAKPETMPIETQTELVPVLNRAQAELLGITVPTDIGFTEV